jgi:hypothetical protein
MELNFTEVFLDKNLPTIDKSDIPQQLSQSVQRAILKLGTKIDSFHR